MAYPMLNLNKLEEQFISRGLLWQKKIKDETECIQDEDNYAEAYWKREEFDEYKKLCANYDAGKPSFKDKDPRDISLREFVCNFTKKWKYSPADVFMYVVQTYGYIIKKGKKQL